MSAVNLSQTAAATATPPNPPANKRKYNGLSDRTEQVAKETIHKSQEFANRNESECVRSSDRDGRSYKRYGNDRSESDSMSSDDEDDRSDSADRSSRHRSSSSRHHSSSTSSRRRSDHHSSSYHSSSRDHSSSSRTLGSFITEINDFFKKKFFRDAESLAIKACKAHPTSYEVLYLKGKACSHLNKFPEALEILNEALRCLNKIQATDAKSRAFINSEIIRVHIALGNLETAKTLLEKIFKHPDVKDEKIVALHKIIILAAEDKHSEVVNACNEFLSKNPDYDVPLYYRGFAYLALNDFAKAEENLCKAAKTNKAAHVGLGKIALHKKDYKKAYALFTTFLDSEKVHAPHPNVWRRKIYDEAVGLYNDVVCNYAKSLFLTATGHEDLLLAEKLFKEVLSKDPHNLTALFGLAELQFSTLDFANALENLNKVIAKQIDFDNGKPLLFRACIMIKKDLGKALNDIETVLKLPIQTHNLLWDKIIVELKQLREDQMDANQKQRIASIIVQKQPNSLQDLSIKGLQLASSQKYSEALPLFDIYLSRVGKPQVTDEEATRKHFIQVLRARAEIYFTHILNSDKAKQDYRLLNELDPENKDYQSKLELYSIIEDHPDEDAIGMVPNAGTSLMVPAPIPFSAAAVSVLVAAATSPFSDAGIAQTRATAVSKPVSPVLSPSPVPGPNKGLAASNSTQLLLPRSEGGAVAAAATSIPRKQESFSATGLGIAAPLPQVNDEKAVSSKMKELSSTIRVSQMIVQHGLQGALNLFLIEMRSAKDKDIGTYCAACLHVAICYTQLNDYQKANELLYIILKCDPLNFEALMTVSDLGVPKQDTERNILKDSITLFSKKKPLLLDDAMTRMRKSKVADSVLSFISEVILDLD